MITEIIKKVLREKKITIDELAVKIGYSRMGLTNALNSGDLKISVLKKISDVLQVEMSSFFENPDDRFKSDLFLFLTSNRLDLEEIKKRHKGKNKSERSWHYDKKEDNYLMDEFSIYLKEKLTEIYWNTVFIDINLFNKFFKQPKIDILFINSTNTCFLFADDKPEIYFPNPININKVVENVFQSTDRELLKVIKHEVELREDLFIKTVNSNLFIKWLMDVKMLDNLTMSKLLMQISKEYSPKVTI